MTGLMLGIAQYTSRIFLLNKGVAANLLLGGVTLTLYILATIQWIQVLKSAVDLSGAYAIVVLGVFTGILTANFLQKNADISIQDIVGISLIAAGSALIKR